MSNSLEIERKFLIRFPDKKYLDIKRKLEILQIYLENGSNNSQRRVRKIKENNTVKYFYTEKIFISDEKRQETEYEIKKSEYQKLLCEKRNDCVPIEKQRICFVFRNQLFEMDIYPFSDRLAILELELESTEQEIFFPDYIDVIKEVTGIDEYSNISLANAGVFPKGVY